MQDYLIFIDVSSDFDYEIYQKNDVRLVPMEFNLNEKIIKYEKDSSFSYKEFYDSLKNGSMAKTSQITPFNYEEIFEPTLKEGKDILYISLSSGLSKTYESASLAKNNLKEKYQNNDIYVLDSLTGSGGMGILLEKAIENKLNGFSILENFNDLNELKKHQFGCAFVDDLMHLKRGGRVGSASAFIGSLLNVKPFVEVTEKGGLNLFTKVIGNKKAALKLAELYKEHALFSTSLPVFINHADNLLFANLAKQEILKINSKANVKITVLSPIIGTHLGPKSIAMFFIKK